MRGDTNLYGPRGKIRIPPSPMPAWRHLYPQPGLTKIYSSSLSLLFLQVFQRQEYYSMADYYSLGVTVYKMATGKHPFYTDQKSPYGLQMAMNVKAPHYPEDMDTDLRDLIDRVSRQSFGFTEKIKFCPDYI